MNEDDLKIKEGTFSNFNKIIEKENWDEIKNILIKINNKIISLKDIKISIPKRTNCVLGTHRDIDINRINEFFEKYHKVE